MRRALRGLGLAVAIVAALAAAASGWAWWASGRGLARTYPFHAVALAVPTDAATVAEGKRLATLRGCVDGCHGPGVGGGVFFDAPAIGRIVAPDLAASARLHDDGDLAAMIRRGVRPDGRSMMVMPSEAFVALDDADLARIVAYLKSLPAGTGPGASVSLGPLGRLGVAAGRFRTTADRVAEAKPAPPASGSEAARGRYLAVTVCGHCHGVDLAGAENPDFASPSLNVVGAYSPEAFARLLRTGESVGGRPLPTMGPWARGHLARLTDAEIAALYAYLGPLPPPAARP